MEDRRPFLLRTDSRLSSRTRVLRFTLGESFVSLSRRDPLASPPRLRTSFVLTFFFRSVYRDGIQSLRRYD